MATLVRFYHEDKSVLAYFPQKRHSFNGYRYDLKVCYSHVGQHSSCAPEYAKKLSVVKYAEDCKDLIAELTQIGYDLKVLNKFKEKVTK